MCGSLLVHDGWSCWCRPLTVLLGGGIVAALLADIVLWAWLCATGRV